MVTLTLDKVGVKMGGRRVVRDASARFEAGTLVGVIGPNGAGKSSLVRAILALVASSGHILLDRVPIERMDRTSLARAMAYLPQGQTLHWPVSVERLVGGAPPAHVTVTRNASATTPSGEQVCTRSIP